MTKENKRFRRINPNYFIMTVIGYILMAFAFIDAPSHQPYDFFSIFIGITFVVVSLPRAFNLRRNSQLQDNSGVKK